jgi:hypothetical protein
MHRNRQNGQLHALQREAGRLQHHSIEITVAVRHPSAIHLSVIEQKTVPGTVLSSNNFAIGPSLVQQLLN